MQPCCKAEARSFCCARHLVPHGLPRDGRRGLRAHAGPAIRPLALLGWGGGLVSLVAGGCVTLFTAFLIAGMATFGGKRHIRFRDLSVAIYGAPRCALAACMLDACMQLPSQSKCDWCDSDPCRPRVKASTRPWLPGAPVLLACRMHACQMCSSFRHACDSRMPSGTSENFTFMRMLGAGRKGWWIVAPFQLAICVGTTIANHIVAGQAMKVPCSSPTAPHAPSYMSLYPAVYSVRAPPLPVAALRIAAAAHAGLAECSHAGPGVGTRACALACAWSSGTSAAAMAPNLAAHAQALNVLVTGESALTLTEYIIVFGAFNLIIAQIPHLHSLRFVNIVATFSTIGFSAIAVGLSIYSGAPVPCILLPCNMLPLHVFSAQK